MEGNIGPVAITVLGRAPEPGRVKTRLARDVGDAAAAEIQEALALDVLDRLHAWLSRRSAGGSLVLAIDGSPGAVEALSALAIRSTPGLRIERQEEGGLGERIEGALARRAAEGAARSWVAGTDCPFLGDSLLDAASTILEEPGCHAVLVPAVDGGFVLLGAGRLPAGTLSGIEWGTSNVLESTRSALARVGVSTRLSGGEEDLDDLEGLRRLAARLAVDPTSAPRTAAWLCGRRFL